MTFFWCPRCLKDVYVLKLKWGRVIRRDKDGSGYLEGLCPKCGLFIGTDGMTDIPKDRPKAPKDYHKEFPSWGMNARKFGPTGRKKHAGR